METGKEEEEFAERKNSVFAQLDKIRNNLSSNLDIEKAVKRKKPSAASVGTVAANTLPNYKKQPEKWTKYDLKETNVSSDRQNTLAGFSFLHDLKKRAKTEDNSTVDNSAEPMSIETVEDNGIKFKKPMQPKGRRHGEAMKTDCAESSKVELDHLEENVSAEEYQAAILAKWEDKNKTDSTILESGSAVFKNPQKSNRKGKNIRARVRRASDSD
uniref:protein TSSC4-like n=1 Tax=Ciona intestinalis TaxID=7719 RepID=UPI0005213062|nr:protein TSSC4-like [Ciona intestinalis]|eukprot:XP_009858771.1 protein TSSC4-like [Ciona intestinalis]